MTAKSRPVSQEDNDKLSAFTSALASTDMHKTAYLTHRERSKWVHHESRFKVFREASVDIKVRAKK